MRAREQCLSGVSAPREAAPRDLPVKRPQHSVIDNLMRQQGYVISSWRIGQGNHRTQHADTRY
ncbi:hypothetical protein [Xenorhabdus sp. PB62.4]|uniref:hypothetical protein n=1 Tax=Xenorhabdus sp. PB62.4 TaxID=1851573 RepID=UPI0016573CA2|nr:hypothetical protein [Xenorhabdus sp. PB62.4]